MRSGRCSGDDSEHKRCRMASCSCPQHDGDLKAKAAALVDSLPTIAASRGSTVPTTPTGIEKLEAGVDLLDGEVRRAKDGDSALRLLYDLRQVLGSLHVLEASLIQTAYLHGEHGDVRIEGLPPVKVTRGRDRREWDPRGAVFAYLGAKLEAVEGEYPDPRTVADWVMEVLPANASTSCKVTALRAAGIEPKDYCIESPGRLTVTFTE